MFILSSPPETMHRRHRKFHCEW